MIKHVGTVCVYVKDQQKALEFYRDVLGFEVRQDQPMGPNARWIEVAPKGSETRVVPFTPPGQEDRIGTFSGVVFSCDDIEATYLELTAKGVEFKQKLEKQPWGGILAQFYDVDRNTHVLVQV
ncbi:MAG: VOC family protein [Candidatus Acidiferrales bacterium]|jgi:lactoylglutathione lyase